MRYLYHSLRIRILAIGMFVLTFKNFGQLFDRLNIEVEIVEEKSWNYGKSQIQRVSIPIRELGSSIVIGISQVEVRWTLLNGSWNH